MSERDVSKQKKIKKWLLLFLQIFITLVFLFLTFHNTKWNELKSAFQKVNYAILLLTLLPQFVSIFILAAREKYLLKKIYSFKFGDLIKGVVISLVGSNILPLRGGEVLKVLYWKRQSAQSLISLGSVALIERFLDLFCLIGIFFVGSTLIMEKLGIKIEWILFVAAFFVVPIVVLLLVDRMSKNRIQMPTIATKFLRTSTTEKCNIFLHKLVLGFRVLGEPKNIIFASGFTVLYWILNLLGLFIILYAFHLNPSWQQTVVVLLATSFGVAIPAAPGNIGTYDYFAKLSLVLYGYSASIATSFAIVSHIISVVPLTVIGMIFVYSTLKILK